MIRRPPRSTRTDTLFPYTTLFRSANAVSVFELIVEDRSPPFPQPRRDFAQSEKRPADVPIDWQIRSSAASTFGHTAPTAAAADSQLCMLNWFTLLAMSCI